MKRCPKNGTTPYHRELKLPHGLRPVVVRRALLRRANETSHQIKTGMPKIFCHLGHFLENSSVGLSNLTVDRDSCKC